MEIKWCNFLKREGVFIISSLSFFLLFVFQTKTLNTGDAGELITASYGLGIAHPSGYPIYLMISKLFTFLPFGNIPTKVALVSSLSSFILILLGINFLKKENLSFEAYVFFVIILLSCYSFFCQSLIAKFYPLNTILIFLIFLLGYDSLKEYKIRSQLIIFFLLGLSLGLHQTTFFMILPLSILLIIYPRNVFKHIVPSLIALFLGASSVLYLVVRSWKPTLLNMSPSGDLHSLIYTLLRKAYGKSSSVQVAKSFILFDIHRFLYAIKNSFFLLYREFHLYSFFFFFSGLLYLWIKNRKAFFYISLYIFTYSVVLAYFTLFSKKMGINEWYIPANQYYLPLFLMYALVSAFGFELVCIYLKEKFVGIWSLKHVFLLFPFIYIPQHLFLNFYDKNMVAYYKTIDQLFIKPIKSIVIYSGDNDIFQGWYVKNVEKFRDDICILATPKIGNKVWNIENGCCKLLYKDSYKMIFESDVLNLATLRDYMREKRVFSNAPIEACFKKHLKSEFSVLDFLVLEKSEDKGLEDLLSKDRKRSLDFLHYQACLNHSTDDLFTKALCMKYANYFTFLAYDLGKKDKHYPESIVNVSFEDKTYKLHIHTSKKNEWYLFLAYKIMKYNRFDDYYLYKGL